ncbi:hypothetical protein ACQR2B_06515 [Bradyrhizobium oligotrophicum]|uniref:hypothetical protein n=1 Tax=Bradyrhizobium TaxID=374 RepID=UPI003EB914AE
MRRLITRLKRLFCRHWFDVVERETQFSTGPMICFEVKTWVGTFQDRTCSKCGLVETRRVGEAKFIGWC